MPKRWSKCYSTELNTVTSSFNQYKVMYFLALGRERFVCRPEIHSGESCVEHLVVFCKGCPFL